MPIAYVIANAAATDPAQYEACLKCSSSAMQAHSAEIGVRGGKVDVVEGVWVLGFVFLSSFCFLKEINERNC